LLTQCSAIAVMFMGDDQNMSFSPSRVKYLVRVVGDGCVSAWVGGWWGHVDENRDELISITSHHLQMGEVSVATSPNKRQRRA
jgi:hypothetical protein